MRWLLLRAMAVGVALAIGGLFGHELGQGAQSALLGASSAAAALMSFFFIGDALWGQRLIAWLSGERMEPAPRGAGLWGELGHRVERAVRAEAKASADGQTRLAHFLSAIEASPIGVLLLDATEHIEWFNRTAAEHFGLDPTRDRQQRVTNLVRAPAFVSHLQSGNFDDGVTFPRPPGDGLISVVVRPYGEAMRIVLSQDITARERSDTMRRDFVANVSHEIRSPLTVLAGFVETMAKLPLTEVERRRVLELMTQQTTRMQNLVTDLLALAQIEGAPKPAADRWIGVDELLRQVETAALALSQGQHRVHIESHAASEIGGVESELFSAVWNLVSNALRYSAAGGEVTVSWRVREQGGGEFSVRDTGMGIPREHLPRLTERFYRVDGSRSRETGGTGLGLAIVKHVVQRHGGELDVRSELGKGSTFSFDLPAFRVRAATRAAAATELVELSRT
jgi:two-component system phosphate regulon sensor histidine kinase PhoR